MRTQTPLDAGRSQSSRLIAVALVALLVGALIGPGVASAATNWVKIKNWPSLLKVLVKNTTSSPVYTQPVGHEIVTLRASATIPAFNTFGSSANFYTVPAGKWLVITAARCTGQGNSPASVISVLGNGGQAADITFPFTTVLDGGGYYVAGSVNGPIYVPAGTTLQLSIARATSPNTAWGAMCYIDGYLTDKP